MKKFYTKSEWKATVRLGRRSYYDSLNEEQKAEFIKHIKASYDKKDPWGVKFWNKNNPGMITEDK